MSFGVEGDKSFALVGQLVKGIPILTGAPSLRNKRPKLKPSKPKENYQSEKKKKPF